MATHTNGTTTNGTSNGAVNGNNPKITLYTNHICPWAHRAHITLRALKIPYEEVIIPLDRPRDPWYLEINTRGLVPAIKITTADGKLKDDIITESAIVATFLADLFPHPTFWPRSEEDPLKRARINYFVDTWFSKVNSFMVPMLKAEGEEKEKVAGDLVAAIEKEIEPLLENAAPFFGGSESLTLAEALTAPFVIRFRIWTEHGLLPANLVKSIDALPSFSKWSKAVCAEDAVTYVIDAPHIAKVMAERIAKMKASAN